MTNGRHANRMYEPLSAGAIEGDEASSLMATAPRETASRACPAGSGRHGGIPARTTWTSWKSALPRRYAGSSIGVWLQRPEPAIRARSFAGGSVNGPVSRCIMWRRKRPIEAIGRLRREGLDYDKVPHRHAGWESRLRNGVHERPHAAVMISALPDLHAA